MSKMRPVGVVGLGRMGEPLAIRLGKMRSDIYIWDVNPDIRNKVSKNKNLFIAEPIKMSQKCSVIFFVVPSSKEIKLIFSGKFGILRNGKKGLIVFDLTTSDPIETKKIAEKASEKSISYLDAAMSGGPSGIQEGKLTLMIGGDKKVLIKTKNVLSLFTDNIFHLGEIGSGQTMKLIHNMVLHTMFLATCEGARLAERMGINVKDMIDVFNVSTAFSYASKHRFPNNILSGKWNALARIYNMDKDVGLAIKLAKKNKLKAELGEKTLEFIHKAVSRGMIEDDLSLLYRDFDDIQKMKI